jgi:hypothetical protein
MKSLLIVKGEAVKSCADRTDGYRVINRHIQPERYVKLCLKLAGIDHIKMKLDKNKKVLYNVFGGKNGRY